MHSDKITRGVQRAKFRQDAGNAIGFVGFIAGTVAGFVSGSFLVFAGVFLTLGAVGLAVRYR